MSARCPVRRSALNLTLVCMVTLILGCESDRTCAPDCGHVLSVRQDSSGDYATIQRAIEAADCLDVIELADGRYVLAVGECIDFMGKGITVRSRSRRAESCIIDCRQQNLGFYFHRNEGKQSILEHLTIVNSKTAAVFCQSSAPTIRNCIVSWEKFPRGNGIYLYRSAASITGCVISGSWWDSAISVHKSSGAVISDCVVTGNSAATGGGLYCYESTVEIGGCRIVGNKARDSGGGIYLSNSSARIRDCVLTGNESYYCGGAIGADPGATAVISGCTLSGNYAADRGGAILSWQAPLVLSRTILWGNCCGGEGDEVFARLLSGQTCSIEFSCCLVDSQRVMGDCEIEYSDDNLFVDPLFCSPAQCAGTQGADGDYRLQPASPCLPENNPWCVLIGALPKGCD
jgi:parallel beta-helix repeat protein